MRAREYNASHRPEQANGTFNGLEREISAHGRHPAMVLPDDLDSGVSKLTLTSESIRSGSLSSTSIASGPPYLPIPAILGECYQ